MGVNLVAVLTLIIIISAVFDISALGMADNKKTCIFHQPCFSPFLADLQPVKIQLNNSVRSAFTPPFRHIQAEARHTHTHTHAQVRGSMIYGLWLLLLGNVFPYWQLTCIFTCILFWITFIFLCDFSSSLSPPLSAVLATSGYKHINPISPFLSFPKAGISELI